MFKSKTVDVDGTPKTITVQPNSYKLVNGGAESNTLPAYKAGTTDQIGTYTIDSATGQVTFTPSDKTYSGAVAPVSVQATGSNGVKVETTYTPIITPVTPTAEASATSDVQGKKQTSSIVLDTPENSADKDKTVNFNKGSQVGANGERVELDASTLTLLDGNNEVSTLTTNDGEYVLDKASKTITFTPNKTFTGQAKAVKVQIKDANGTKVETTYTPTVTEVTPTGKDSATTGLQGFAQKSPIVFNQKDEEDGKTVNFDTGNEKVALKPDTLTLLNGNEKVKTITVPDVGTYELKDNAITFTPLPSYHGTPEGVTVQIEDENGKLVTKKYVPTVTQVTPSGTNATSSGLQGKVQTGKPVFNGGVPEVPMNDEVPATLEGADQDGKVVIAGKGTYTVAKDGTVTFTPDKNFVGVAPAVTVKRVDKNGTIATATYTPTVTDVSMTSENKTSEALQGKTQTGTPTFTISTPDVRITEYKLVDPTNNKSVEEVEVENQGTYSIDKATGEVTFVPKPGFTGPTTGITVRATDENGETKDATYTPSVTPLKVTPENKQTTNIQGLPQEATPTFKLPKGVTNAVVTERKLIDPITKSLTNSVTVDGKGTFTINANGKVTFTPVPSYVGDVPAIEVQGTITVLNDNNDRTTITSKASYKPIIVPIELEKTPAESTSVQGLVQKGTPKFTSPESVEINGVEKTVTVKPNSYKLVKDGTETDSIPAYKKDTQEVIGKYTIDSQTGEVTFIPTDKTYTGEVEPATVQATGSNNVKVQTTYTPIIKPVKPVGTNAGSEGIQGAPQSGTPSFKSGNENIPMTVSATNPAKLVDPTTNQPIEATEIDAKNTAGEKVGKYTIDPATGKVTFTPEPGFSGTPVPATVQAKDGNGTPTTATYTPVVKAAVPSGDNQVTSDIQGAKQTATPVFTPGKNTVNNQEVSVPFEATSKAKLIDPSKTGDEREVTTLVVENQGTYTIDDNGVVTFTPLPTFKGEATAVSIVRKDKNGTPATATFKPSVVGVAPSATEATTTKVQGATQETPVTFTPGKATIGTAEKSVPMDSASYKLLGGQEGKTPLDTVPAMSEDGTKEVGTYTIKVVDGKPVVTFTPTDKTYAGKLKPVTVQGKDTNGTEATTTYTPVITPIVPTAENGTSEGPQGVEQTGSVTFKPGKEPGTENTPVAIDKAKMTLLGTDGNPVESLTVSKDGKEIGTYTLVKDPSGLPTGEVKFTPTDKSYVGEVPPATVQVKDANGTPVTATYTPTFTEVNPTGKDSATTGLQGFAQKSPIVFNQKDEEDKTTVNFDTGHEKVTFKEDTLTLVNAAGDKVTTVTVPDVGTYELKDGVITFTPLKTFKGKPEGVTVQVEDVNGKVVKQKYVPNVVEILPTGKDTTSTGLQGKVQTGTPEFTPGSPEVPMDDEVPATFEDGNVTKTVDKVGTYTVAKDGTVTFTPNKDFSGEAPEVTVKRVDKNGTSVTAKYKPTVTKVTPTGKDTTSTGLQGKVQTGTPVFTPGNPEVPMDDESPATFEDGNITKTVDKVGTYTVAKDGTVTFTPNKDFSGEAPEVTVKRVDKNGTSVTAKYKPTVTKVTPTGKDTTSTGLQGKVQTGTPVFTPGNPEVPMDDEVAATFDNGQISKKVDKVGTYTVAKDGTVTFTPDKEFVGEAPEVTVKRVDKNGTAVTAKYKPIVAKVLPTGESSETEGAKGKPQTSAVIFDKKDEDKSTVNFNKGDETVALNPSTLTLVDKNGNPSTEVKVPGEGTYTLANNVITFTPEKDFAGKATGVTVQVKDINGTSIEKTYTPTVRAVTTFVDPSGNPITVDKNNKPVQSEVDGSKQPTKDIYGYKFVRTETDNKGNTKHIYEQAEGKSVKVTYVSTTGETLSDSQTVETKDKFIGTDYDASIEALKLERIEKDGKVYLLKERKADSASENGKLSDQEQTVTYVYEEVKEPASNQKYGNVVVVYKDKFGRPISGTTESGKEVASTEIDTPSSPINTEYDTTDHKPQTITTKDGKKYKLVNVLKTSDAEKSGVKARTSVITYVYEMLGNTAEYPEAHIGLVLVNYLDEEGNPISGKTPEGKVVPNMVVDTEADLVGKDYDTTDHKVSTIIVENGDVYELLKVSESSVEKGKLTEGATNVNYIYHKVVTKFVDENGKEIKSPEKGRTDKKDIPEYTFKETKKDVNGNTVHVYTKKSSSTPVTPTPTPSTPSTEKETLYVDANGKPLQPAKKGQHPQDNIPGYEFVRTETDANGNVRHLYRKIQSTIPVEPVQPTAPTMPEQPAQPEVPTSPAQPVQPTEVKEVEAKRELPNTGTEDHTSLAALGLLGALSGFGLLASKKKED